MVSLYVAGEKVGTLADIETLFSELIAQRTSVEFRDDAGKLVGRFTPVESLPSPEPLVPWDPTITHEELQRRMAGPFVTYEELKKRLGWE